jgi:PTH2 family peptidyl-tRNA hydrolase
MSPGKLAAQVAHASLGAVIQLGKVHTCSKENGELLKEEYLIPIQHFPALNEWLFKGDFTKIVLGVDSEEELMEFHQKMTSAGLMPVLIEDSGKTEFNGVKTATCLGLPPYVSEEINKYTGSLKLF